MTLEFVIYILIIILALVIWSIVTEISTKKRRIIRLKEKWGNIPDEEYTSEKLESLKAFYLSMKDDQLDVDDITWNDLDMDDVFMLMNNTQSSIGEEYLYALLRKPCFSQEELEERNRLIHFFSNQENDRVKLQISLSAIGKVTRISVFEYINRLSEQAPKSNLPHYLMIISLFLSVGLIFVSPGIGGILTVVCVVNNILQYYRAKAGMENYLLVFAYICRLLDGIKELYKSDIPEIRKYTDLLKKDYDTFRKFRRGSVILTQSQPTGNLEDVFLDYVRILFHIDQIKYNTMLTFLKNHREELNRIYINVGYLDSMVAIASFREFLPYYCEPVLEKETKPFLSVTDLYHPLLENPVPNSITESGSVLITGSNASGKSTFIKTLAINAILAQTIHTSVSKGYRASYFIIYSSMALRDNIFSNESYYIVEIKSLKRILDRIRSDIPVLCFIDEVLRGTNTLERIAASSRILSYLAEKNALVMAATHDIELTHILEDQYSNYHFQERIEENEIIFDYKLIPGKAVSKNAIKLLDMLKFPKEITANAEAAAEDFLNHGEWSKIGNYV